MAERGLQLGSYALMHAGGGNGPVFLDGMSPTVKSQHWATDVADLVKWNISSLKVDSVEVGNITAAFNVTYPALSDSLVTAGYKGVYTCSWPAYEMYHGWPIQYERMAKYCNTWRNYADVQCNTLTAGNKFSCWESVAGIRDYWGGQKHTHDDYDRFVSVAGPGHWID
jgi:hypothetical protein